jgi:hypothetical protein
VPAALSTRPRPTRLNSGVPIASSSRPSVRDTAAGVSDSRRAAAATEPLSAISANAGSQFHRLRRRLVIMKTV